MFDSLPRKPGESDYDWGWRRGMSGEILPEANTSRCPDEFTKGYIAGFHEINSIIEEVTESGAS